MICAFFGHADCPDNILPRLKTEIEKLIENASISDFYIGNQGNFDRLVHVALEELKIMHPHIRICTVLAYMPQKGTEVQSDYCNTILPEGMETVPRKYAISARNRWMVNKADYVVIYVARPFGGAAQFAALAEKKNKTCINLAQK